MQSSSSAFATAILSGATYASRAVIYNSGQVVEDTYYGGSYLTLLADDSSVSYDRSGDSRTSASVSFLMMKDDAETIVDPLSFSEISLHSGIMIGAEIEWIDLGILCVESISAVRTGDSVVISVSCIDRSSRIRNNAWKSPYQVASGLDYYVGIKNIVTDRARGFTPDFNLGSNALTTTALNFGESEDPWAAAMKLAEAVGAELYFDRQGSVTAMPIPDPLTTAPSLSFKNQESGMLLTPVTRSFSNGDTFNGVICRGEAPWLLIPVTGEIWDDDPLSNTYRLGPFGEKPKIIGDSLASTDAQCLAAATAEWNRVKGAVENITFETVKDPRLEVGDIIDELDEILSITGRYVLETYSYPLGSGQATGLVKRKR